MAEIQNPYHLRLFWSLFQYAHALENEKLIRLYPNESVWDWQGTYVKKIWQKDNPTPKSIEQYGKAVFEKFGYSSWKDFTEKEAVPTSLLDKIISGRSYKSYNDYTFPKEDFDKAITKRRLKLIEELKSAETEPSPPDHDPLPQEVVEGERGGGTLQEVSPLPNFFIPVSPAQMQDIVNHKAILDESQKSPEYRNEDFLRMLLNTQLDSMGRIQASLQMNEAWKEEAGFKLFDAILYGQDSHSKTWARQLSKGTKDDIEHLRKNQTDFPYWHRSLVVSALTLSIAQYPDPDKLELLFDFVKEEEPFVWKRALVGIALNSLNRPHIIFDNPRFAGFWNKLHTQPHTAEALLKIETVLFDVRQNKEQTLIRFYQQWIPQYEYFEKPQHWFLPFYEGNPISQKTPNELADLLYYSSSWDLSLGKYVFCWQYEKLNPWQQFRFPQILENEKRMLLIHPLLIEKYGADVRLGGLYEAEVTEYVQELYFFYQNYDRQQLQSLFEQQATLLKSSLVKIEALTLNSAEAYNNMGSAYRNLGQYSQAIEAFKKAIKFKNDYHEAYNNMGIAYYNLEQYSQAIEAYQNAIKFKNDYHEAYNNMGIAYYNLGQYSQAIEAYQKAIKFKNDYHEAYNNMGNAYDNLGQYSQAIEAFKKAIKFKNDYHEAYYNMGIAYANLGQYLEAIEAYQNAIQFKADFHQAYYNIGNAYRYLGQKEDALQCYLKSQQLGESVYNLACWYAVEGQKAEALRWLRQALDKEQISLAHLAQDADWEELREDAEFKALVEGY